MAPAVNPAERRSIVDTNLLVRFFTGDGPDQFEQAKEWMREGEEGKRILIIHPIVVAECCFVLESFYKLPREKIAEAMELLLGQRWLRVREREPLLALWKAYRKGLHFVDSFLLASAQIEKSDVLTFDKTIERYKKKS